MTMKRKRAPCQFRAGRICPTVSPRGITMLFADRSAKNRRRLLVTETTPATGDGAFLVLVSS